MARKTGSRFSVNGKSADDRAIAEAKALASEHRRKRAKAARESADLERQGRRIGTAIRRSVREAERQHLGYVTVRPARISGSRKGRTVCPRFETMLDLNVPRQSHVGGDGLSSFHFKWSSRGLKPRPGQKNAHRYRPGEAVHHVRYILRDDAREQSGCGIVSNISIDPDDIASLFGAIEEFEQAGGQDNANIYCSLVIALPKELDAEGRQRVLRQIGEELQKEELPYCFAPHRPDPRGSQDNWHAHGMFSLRPFRKRADGSYDLAAMPSSDLNDATFITHLREVAARAMNVEMERAGAERRFTPRSYEDRGLDKTGEAKRGPGRKNIERREQDLAAMRVEHGMLTRFITLVEALSKRLETISATVTTDRAARLGRLRDRVAAVMSRHAPALAPIPTPVASAPHEMAAVLRRTTAPIPAPASGTLPAIGTSQSPVRATGTKPGAGEDQNGTAARTERGKRAHRTREVLQTPKAPPAQPSPAEDPLDDLLLQQWWLNQQGREH